LPFGSPPVIERFDAALAALATWAQIGAEHSEFELIAIGHCSSDGTAPMNERLSLWRSGITHALLTDNRDLWESSAEAGLSSCDLACIFAWIAQKYTFSAHFESIATPTKTELAEACRQFQAGARSKLALPLEIDGICGPQTRHAIFCAIERFMNLELAKRSVQRAAIRMLSKFDLIGAGSEFAGSSPTIPRLSKWANGRIVDLLLLIPGELSACESLPLAKIYLSDHVNRHEHPLNNQHEIPFIDVVPEFFVPDDRDGVANMSFCLNIGRKIDRVVELVVADKPLLPQNEYAVRNDTVFFECPATGAEPILGYIRTNDAQGRFEARFILRPATTIRESLLSLASQRRNIDKLARLCGDDRCTDAETSYQLILRERASARVRAALSLISSQVRTVNEVREYAKPVQYIDYDVGQCMEER
jgi:hypothetical protein